MVLCHKPLVHSTTASTSSGLISSRVSLLSNCVSAKATEAWGLATAASSFARLLAGPFCFFPLFSLVGFLTLVPDFGFFVELLDFLGPDGFFLDPDDFFLETLVSFFSFLVLRLGGVFFPFPFPCERSAGLASRSWLSPCIYIDGDDYENNMGLKVNI